MLDTKKLPKLRATTERPEVGRKNSVKFYLVGFFVVCLSTYLAMCFQAEQVLRSYVVSVLKEVGANGFGVSHSKIKSAYFALHSGVYLDDLVLIAPEGMGSFQLKFGRISLGLNPLFPRKINLLAQGSHAFVSKESEEVLFMTDKVKATLLVSKRETGRKGDISVLGVKVTSQGLLSGFFLNHAQIIWTVQENRGRINFTALFEAMTLPEGIGKQMPKQVERLRAEGVISGNSINRVKPLIEDWMDNSGMIEISAGEVIYPPFRADFSGSFYFDPSFSLTAALTAKMYGFFEVLEKMKDQEIVRQSNLSVSKVVLGASLQQDEGDLSPYLSAPVSIQSGKVYVGQVLVYE